MQMLVAVESVGDSESQSESQFAVSETAPPKGVAFSGLWLNNPSQDVEEVLSGFLKITQRSIVKKSYRSI